MTQHEYKGRLFEIECEIKSLEKERRELTESFLNEHAIFKEGDKVLIIDPETIHPFLDNKIIPERKTEAFIMQVHDSGLKGSVNYKFWKVRKDGSKSSHELHRFSYGRIELIESAKPLQP